MEFSTLHNTKQTAESNNITAKEKDKKAAKRAKWEASQRRQGGGRGPRGGSGGAGEIVIGG